MLNASDNPESRLRQTVPPEPVALRPISMEPHAAAVPRALTRFIGREREIAAVASQLEEGVRLLTLTGPDGAIGAHTHPAVMWVTVESGQFGLTLLEDAEMTVTRAATADSEATQETLEPNVEVVLEAGDGFVETGMVHNARDKSSTEPMSTIFAAVVESGQPLTQCVDLATPAASTGNHATVR